MSAPEPALEGCVPGTLYGIVHSVRTRAHEVRGRFGFRDAFPPAGRPATGTLAHTGVTFKFTGRFFKFICRATMISPLQSRKSVIPVKRDNRRSIVYSEELTSST